MRTFLLATALAVSAAAHAADPIEGRWQVTDGGPIVEICPAPEPGRPMTVRWIDGPDLSVLPGTDIAGITPAVAAGVYDCVALKDPRGDKGYKGGTARFVIRLDTARPDRFAFEPYERKIVFNLRVLLPWWYRRAVNVVDSRPSGLDGAVRCDALPRNIEL